MKSCDTLTYLLFFIVIILLIAVIYKYLYPSSFGIKEKFETEEGDNLKINEDKIQELVTEHYGTIGMEKINSAPNLINITMDKHREFYNKLIETYPDISVNYNTVCKIVEIVCRRLLPVDNNDRIQRGLPNNPNFYISEFEKKDKKEFPQIIIDNSQDFYLNNDGERITIDILITQLPVVSFLNMLVNIILRHDCTGDEIKAMIYKEAVLREGFNKSLITKELTSSNYNAVIETTLTIRSPLNVDKLKSLGHSRIIDGIIHIVFYIIGSTNLTLDVSHPSLDNWPVQHQKNYELSYNKFHPLVTYKHIDDLVDIKETPQTNLMRKIIRNRLNIRFGKNPQYGDYHKRFHDDLRHYLIHSFLTGGSRWMYLQLLTPSQKKDTIKGFDFALEYLIYPINYWFLLNETHSKSNFFRRNRKFFIEDAYDEYVDNNLTKLKEIFPNTELLPKHIGIQNFVNQFGTVIYEFTKHSDKYTSPSSYKENIIDIFYKVLNDKLPKTLGINISNINIKNFSEYHDKLNLFIGETQIKEPDNIKMYNWNYDLSTDIVRTTFNEFLLIYLYNLCGIYSDNNLLFINPNVIEYTIIENDINKTFKISYPKSVNSTEVVSMFKNLNIDILPGKKNITPLIEGIESELNDIYTDLVNRTNNIINIESTIRISSEIRVVNDFYIRVKKLKNDLESGLVDSKKKINELKSLNESINVFKDNEFYTEHPNIIKINESQEKINRIYKSLSDRLGRNSSQNNNKNNNNEIITADGVYTVYQNNVENQKNQYNENYLEMLNNQNPIEGFENQFNIKTINTALQDEPYKGKNQYLGNK